MGLRKRGASSQAMVASAQPINVGDFTQSQKLNQKRQPWQDRSWMYYDEIGEIHYAGRYLSNCVAKIRLVGAKEAPNPEDPPIELKDGPVFDAVTSLRKSKGGQRSLLRNTALNLFVAGELVYLATEKYGKQDWEALSVSEIRHIPGANAQRVPYPGAYPQDIPKDALLIRMWVEHPRYSQLADCALRPVLDQCEQLLLLTRAQKAAARSRFAGSGLLFIPIELVPPSWQNSQRKGDEEQQNPLMVQLTEAMITPLSDESHPSSVVPVMIFGPSEYGEKIKYFNFERPLDKQLVAQKDECVRRIAAAIDLPTEVANGQGMSKANHWSALQIHEDAFVAHIQPFIQLIVDALTEGYLQPALQRAGVADADQYMVWYDETELVTKADKSEVAIQAHDRLALSNAALRRETGFDEDDAPDDAEYRKRVGVKLVDARLAITGETPPAAPVAPPGGPPGGSGAGRKTETAQSPGAPAGAHAGPPKSAAERRKTGQESQGPKPGTGDHSPQRKPQGVGVLPPSKSSVGVHPVLASAKADNLGVRLGRLDMEVMSKLQGGANAAVQRCLERAGARIRSRLNGRKDILASVASVPNSLVAATLGPALVAGLDIPSDSLLDDFADASDQAYQWLLSGQEEAIEYLRLYLMENFGDQGLELLAAYIPSMEEAATDAAQVYRQRLIDFATSRLYQQGGAETETNSVPAALMREVVIQAGGGLVTDVATLGGIGTGRIVRDIMGASGVVVEGLTWMYGEDRKKPFEGHLALDGLTFLTMTDAELQVFPEDYWIKRQYYAPGDHWGCRCIVAPYVDDDQSVLPGRNN